MMTHMEMVSFTKRTGCKLCLLLACIILAVIGWFVLRVPRTSFPSLKGWTPVVVAEDRSTGWKVQLVRPVIRAKGKLELEISCPSPQEWPDELQLNFVDNTGKFAEARRITDEFSAAPVGLPLHLKLREIPFRDLDLGPGMYTIECSLTFQSGKVLKLNPPLAFAATMGGY